MQYELPLRSKPPPKYEAGAAWSRWLGRGYVAATWDHFHFVCVLYMFAGLVVTLNLFNTVSDVLQYRAKVAMWDRAYIASKIAQYQEPRPDFVDYYNSNPWLRRSGRISSHVRESRRTRPFSGTQLAFFEAFGTGAQGVTSPCSTTAPTGAKGEVLTFTRASSGTCTKTASGGLATTGIANGDLVSLSTNVARVEYDSAGTLGLLVEATRTNSIIRSEEFTTGWTAAAGGAPSPGAPVVTANAAVAPDGTATADQVDFGATSGTGYGVIYNTAGRTSTAASWAHSLYAKGVSGSGTIYLMSTPGGSYNSVACAYVSTSWTRCSFVGTETVATWYYQIGIDLRDTSQTGKSAQSVYIWGADGEAGAYATSYIPTTTIAEARAVEADYFTHASTVLGSAAVTWQAPPRINEVLLASGDATNGLFIQMANTTTVVSCIYKVGGVSHALSVTGTINPATTTNRASCSHDGAVVTACLNGTCQTGADVFATPSATTTRLGSYFSATFEDDGVNSRACVDPNHLRCR